MFQFEVDQYHFKEALLRFAQFFVAPLLKASSTDRELEAVDSGKSILLLIFVLLQLSLD